ncbi:drug/metabolite transporter (DMT)-like permease [Varunaivibrio sulfuroxidans]|uniref:Drug/metabolite transporter (DMT)-like permease n=1 Tax=Varunaivibrio sulfuroxidans TaxID=1773489 RepID=A0A4R3JAU1_9PROT|nr:drug/metabolite transporter (DMT)-like permease [Varunaivibrio sulfuroxidans]
MSSHARINASMSALEWGMLVALSMLWGGAFFLNGIIVRELPPLTIVFGRMALAALALWGVVRLRGLKMPRNRRVWSAFFIMGFLNNVLPFTLIVWSLGHISSGVAAILNAATPFFTVLVGHRLTHDEKITPSRLIGVAAGLLGVAAMIGETARNALGVDVVAQIAVLGAALSYAFAGVYGRRFRALGIAPIATATGQVTASSLMLFPLMGLIDRPWTLPPPSGSTPTFRSREPSGRPLSIFLLQFDFFTHLCPIASDSNVKLKPLVRGARRPCLGSPFSRLRSPISYIFAFSPPPGRQTSCWSPFLFRSAQSFWVCFFLAKTYAPNISSAWR